MSTDNATPWDMTITTLDEAACAASCAAEDYNAAVREHELAGHSWATWYDACRLELVKDSAQDEARALGVDPSEAFCVRADFAEARELHYLG